MGTAALCGGGCRLLRRNGSENKEVFHRLYNYIGVSDI